MFQKLPESENNSIVSIEYFKFLVQRHPRMHSVHEEDLGKTAMDSLRLQLENDAEGMSSSRAQSRYLNEMKQKNESFRTDVRNLSSDVEIPHLRFGMTFLFFLLILLSAFPASAQNTGYRLKFVFPFGDAEPKICQPQHMTAGGCCEPPQSIYQYNPTLKGCCTPPNEVHGTGTNERCCTPWQPADQPRWGQTTDFPCGGYCGVPNVVSSYSGYTACCSDCPVADGVVAFQTISSVCGTCCSRIPESCGNIGERVCEPGTGSAYCSKTSACNHPNEWSFGSSGEGGFTCCDACEGARYNHTESSCGNCCLPTSEVVAYQTSASCCASLPANYIRFGQAPANVCGDYITCGAGAIPNAEGTACVCDTAGGYKGTWKKDTGDGTGNGCSAACGERMVAAGINAANFTITGSTITYTGNMVVAQDLDISICDLIVNASSGHGLTINSGKTLKVKSVTATTSGSSYNIYGLYNNVGTIIAKESVTGISTHPFLGRGICNNGTIEADTVTGKGGSGIENRYNNAKIKAVTVIGTGTNDSGISNISMIEADTIKGEGKTVVGVHNSSGAVMTATKSVTGIGDAYGVHNDGGILITPILTGTATNESCSVDTGDCIGIRNGQFHSGTIKADHIEGKGFLLGVINSTGGTMEAQTIMGTATGNDSSAQGVFNNGMMTVGTVTGKGSARGILNGAGGTMNATTAIATATGSNGVGFWNVSGKTTVQTLKATATAVGDSSTGIYNIQGKIDATTIEGTGTSTGIVNSATIKATTSVTGTATNVSGTGIYNEIGTIEAPTIYYCPKTLGPLTGSLICKSGCTCTN